MGRRLDGTAEARIYLGGNISARASGSRKKSKHTLWWLGWVLVWKRDLELEQAAFPDGLFLAGDTAIPFLQVHHAVGAAHGLCEKAKGMVSSPRLSGVLLADGQDAGRLGRVPLFREPVDAEGHGGSGCNAGVCA